jgi:hypothetical protein
MFRRPNESTPTPSPPPESKTTTNNNRKTRHKTKKHENEKDVDDDDDDDDDNDAELDSTPSLDERQTKASDSLAAAFTQAPPPSARPTSVDTTRLSSSPVVPHPLLDLTDL